MTRQDDLFAEIQNDPLSDPPRQVLADLLEERGEADRANLIRVQIERESLPAWDEKVLQLVIQERALLAKHEAKWRAELPQLEGVRWGRFARGFVGKVAFDSLAAFDEHLEDCLAASPIHSIVLRWPRGKAPKLGAIETLRELTVVGAVMKPDDMKWLAGSELLGSVRSLNLVDSEIKTGLPHLLKSPHLGKLEALRMPLHHLGNKGLTQLIAATLPSLVELDLSVGSDQQQGSGRRYSSAPITSKGVLEFAAWSGLSRIRSLDLSGSKLGAEGLLMLLASPHTKALKSLRIRNIKDAQWDMDDSLGAFGSGPAGTLEELDVSDNDLDPQAARCMAESKALKELEVLAIDNVRSTAFAKLAEASWIQSLRVLSCGEPALPHVLARAPKHLHSIRVTTSAATTSKIVKHLEAAPPPALTSLDLSPLRMDAEGLRALGTTGALPGLAALVLRRNRSTVSPDEVAELVRSPLGTRVASLDLGVTMHDRLAAPRPLPYGDGEYEGAYRFL